MKRIEYIEKTNTLIGTKRKELIDKLEKLLKLIKLLKKYMGKRTFGNYI